MSKSNLFRFLTFCFLVGFASCNLEKDIDVDLPAYESELVVECYLEPGKPYRLLLSESQDYFNTNLENPFIENAVVSITHRGVTETLDNGTFFDFEFSKFYNFQSPNLVPENYFEDFTLDIVDDRGRTITGTTQIINRVEVDSVVTEYNPEVDSSLVLTYFTDDQTQSNWYRRMLHVGETIDGGELKQDFIFDDNLGAENGVYVTGSGFEFYQGDTIINTLFHLEESYYRYLQSVFDATAANGNPFASPTSIKSNVEGGIGVFAGLSIDRDTIIVP